MVPVLLMSISDCMVPYVDDADVVNKTYRPGDQLVVSCHGGYQIRYPDADTVQSVCQDDGSWANLPVCQGTVILYFLNFHRHLIFFPLWDVSVQFVKSTRAISHHHHRR